MLTDDGTQTGNSNFVGDYNPVSEDAYFDVENFITSHFAVTGFKVQLSHGAVIDGYGTIASYISDGAKFFYEADSIAREYIKYFGSWVSINSNERLMYACGSLGYPIYY
jgi:hypothetical protein